MHRAKKIAAASFTVAALAALSACSASAPSPLVHEWSCGSHTTLTLRENGTFRIASAASQQPSILAGKYTISNNVIVVAGPTMAPLSNNTAVESVDPHTLLLSSPAYGMQQCSRGGGLKS